MRTNVSSRLDTFTSLLSALITSIKRGETKIPQFQRKFVWEDGQAIKLLDSIASNYPIGSLLFWKTKDKLKAERNIGEFKLPDTEDMFPTDYVLDGQQRLTVIYSCLGAPETESGFSVIYDLEKEAFQKTPKDLKIHHFPLRRMFQTTPMLNFRTALQTLPNATVYQERLDQLIQAFTEYRIPVVTLKDMTVNEVCPIFERINSSGTKLSTFDLMVAATWSKTFDLNDEVDEICDALEPKGFSDIDRNTVLKCLSAIQTGSIQEKNLTTLRDLPKPQLDQLVDKTKTALISAVDTFSCEFKIHSWDFLSYEALIIITAYLFADLKKLDSVQVQRLKQWFWLSAFSERYKVGGANFVSTDLKIVYSFIMNGQGVASDFGTPPTDKEWATISFRSNTSRSRAYILALAARGPRNLTNGARIDTANALSAYNKKQYHHVYPRSYLKKVSGSTDDNINANIVMLTATFNRDISDTAPSIYVPQYVSSLGNEADDVFSSNLLPKPSEFDYVTSSYADFITARAKIITSFVSGLCEGKG